MLKPLETKSQFWATGHRNIYKRQGTKLFLRSNIT